MSKIITIRVSDKTHQRIYIKSIEQKTTVGKYTKNLVENLFNKNKVDEDIKRGNIK
jgi:hypothetical protein